MSHIFVRNDIFELLLQIIDDLVVFSRLIFHFKVIGISYYFVCTIANISSDEEHFNSSDNDEK
jgi:hypothetical protein